MFGDHFYHETIKRSVSVFGTLFNNISIKRPDGTYVRFFGKITNLSEDVPTGRVSNKWAVDMATEAVAEIANNGTWLSDGLISMGGILDERPQFI